MIDRTIAKTPLEDWLAIKIGVTGGGLTKDVIAQYQIAKLNETIALAGAASPFYQRHLAGFADKKLTCLADLEQLPFTTANDLFGQGHKMLCVSQSEISQVVTLASSGTTGAEKRLYFTPAEQETTANFFRWCMAALVGAGDRQMMFLPCERPGGVGDLIITGLRQLGAEGVPHGLVHNVPAALAAMVEQQAVSCTGIPVQVLALARYCLKENIVLPVKSVMLCTDYIPQAIALELQKIWNCEVFQHYGMTEMGLGGGNECAAHDGYHLREGDLYFEVMDPVTGKPVGDGEWGEVVFTTLTRRGMPLIRYRTGDYSRFIPEPCPCGTVLRRLATVKERMVCRVSIGVESWLTMAELDEAIFPLAGIVDFSAAVAYHQGKVILKVEAVTMGSNNQEARTILTEALRGIAAVRQAEQAGVLTIVPQLEEWTTQTVPRVGKRTIKILEQSYDSKNDISDAAREGSAC